MAPGCRVRAFTDNDVASVGDPYAIVAIGAIVHRQALWNIKKS